MKNLICRFYPSVFPKDERGHSYYINNLKLFLIICVVFGHFSSKMTWMGKIINLNYFIHLFHMPCFVFISGFLAKKANSNGKFKSDRLLTYFWLYIIFKFAIALISHFFKGTDFNMYLFSDSQAPWYLLSIVFWYAAVPFIMQLKPEAAVLLSFAGGLLIGFSNRAGTTFSISRTIVFFPFFVLGFLLSEERLQKILKNRCLIIISFIFITLLFIFLMYNGKILKPVIRIVYGASSYKSLFGKRITYGFFVRLLWYAASIIISTGILFIIPRCRFPFSHYGNRTLQVYILHILIRNFLLYKGFFKYLKTLPGYINWLIIPFIVILTFFLSNRLFEKLFNRLSLSGLFKSLTKK